MQVSTLKELKRALEAKPDRIEIVDAGLATQVRIIKNASIPAVAAVVAAVGAAATMWWNPVGWVSGAAVAAVGVTAESALIGAVAILLCTLSAALLWALVFDYNIDATIEGKTPVGSGKFSMSLTPKSKQK